MKTKKDLLIKKSHFYLGIILFLSSFYFFFSNKHEFIQGLSMFGIGFGYIVFNIKGIYKYKKILEIIASILGLVGFVFFSVIFL